MDKLVQEIGELRKHITIPSNNIDTTYQEQDAVSIISAVSNELYEQNILDEQAPSHNNDQEDQNFTFEIETKLKEPSVPKTPDSYLKMLNDVQRFGSPSWSEVRYSDTQKTYNHSPGFIDLETNDEVKTYDTLRYLAHADKSYAAITYCILKQKETLQEGIRNLLFWAKNTEITFSGLSDKVEELFLKGEFHKTSSDLLQLACGHRAESIEMRRESITKQVRDPLVKATLNRIPPSQTHIFESEQFTSALDKAGGVRKAFWPPKTDAPSHSKLQQTNRRPSRGQSVRSAVVPSRGTQYMHNETGFTAYPNTYNYPPSRGGCQHGRTYRGQPNAGVSHEHHQYGNRGSFPNRASRSERGLSRGRSSDPRGHSKRYKQ